MRRWFAGLAVLVLLFAMAPIAAAGSSAGAGYRVALSPGAAQAAGLTVRSGLSDGRVSAQVTGTQLAALKQHAVNYELIPERTIAASAKKGQLLPPTQVPYGVKMVYGNPSLTPAEIGGGAGVTVAVLDTGSIAHRDFFRQDGSSIITGCVDFTQNKSPQVEGTCLDKNGHGTHVTGTLAAAGGRDGQGLFGVAPGVNVLSYKVLNDQGRGYADDIALAIRVAADRGANIISMSFGSTTASSLELDAIRYAVANGVLVIAAAGNLGPDPDTISYPAAYAEVVAVGAVSAGESVAAFSSRGITDGNDRTVTLGELELAAPGVNVLSTYDDGAYAVMSGTSMAAPHISGLAAKMWQGSGDRTRDWLRSTASRHDITAADGIANAGVGYDIASGYGLPQAHALSQVLWND